MGRVVFVIVSPIVYVLGSIHLHMVLGDNSVVALSLFLLAIPYKFLLQIYEYTVNLTLSEY